MGNLFKSPLGLLDLTGNKTGGRYPGSLSDTTVTTIPVDVFLKGAALAGEQATIGASGFGATGEIAVPAGEIWLLQSIGIRVGSSATADRFAFDVYAEQTPKGNIPTAQMPLAAFQGNELSSAAASFLVWYQQYAEPIALYGGVVIKAEIVDNTTAGRAWTLRAGVYKFLQ